MGEIVLHRSGCCGCGEEETCAEIAVQCKCCGHESFVNGTSADFYNYLLSCPECDVTWHGHYETEPKCESPKLGITTLTFFGSEVYYRYKGTDGYYHVTPYIDYALQLGTESIITDSCGHEIEVG